MVLFGFGKTVTVVMMNAAIGKKKSLLLDLSVMQGFRQSLDQKWFMLSNICASKTRSNGRQGEDHHVIKAQHADS